jgi:pimeloyl-ACP methyl ester carboxylesterase
MAPLPTQYVDLPDLKMAYCEAGSGEKLLFLHGNSESKEIFLRYQLEHFKDYQTFALDSRGTGRAGRATSPSRFRR